MPQLDRQLDTPEFRLSWLRSILDSADDGIVIIDERSTIQSFNPAAERIFGYERSEVIGNRVEVLMPDPYRSEHESYLTAFFSTGRKKAIGTRREVKGRRKDGAEFPLELSVAEVHSTQGRFFTAILHDISERDLYENAPDMLGAVDAASGAILSCNRTLLTATGYSKSELIGRHISELYHPDCETVRQSVFQSFLRLGEVRDAELQLRRKDGGKIDVSLNVSAVRDGRGNVVRSRSIWRDITERKRMQEELEQSERRFRTMFESAGIGMALDDEDGRLLETNAAFQQMFGYTAEELEGKSFLDLTHPDDVDLGWKLFQELVAGQRDCFHLEKRYLRQDGAVLSGLVTVSAIRDSAGRFQHGVAMVEDITERRRAEQELRHREAELAHATRLSAVSELATGIAHELNQPLATIVNYAESARLRLARDPGSGSEETAIRLEKIAAQAKRAGEIIHRMRHLLRDREPQWSVVDLNECATVIAELIKSEARLKGVSVTTRLAHENPAVSGDGIQIQQVLLNLARNGMDAIAERPADGHTLTITTELVGNGLVRCSVCDSGVGLSDDRLDHLFKPFHTTKRSGLGLGLSVSRWIIEAHGGQISAARRAGGGTVFSFVLPIVRGDDHGGR